MAKFIGGSAIKIDVDVKLEKLNASIFKVAETTGRELQDVVKEAAISFTRSGGKAMPPKNKWGHAAPFRKREVFEKSVSTFFNIDGGYAKNDVEGTRRKKQEVIYCLKFGAKNSNRRTRYFWGKTLANKYRPIQTRGLAKAQFWKALELQGVIKPRSAFTGKYSMDIAARGVSVKKGRGMIFPFVEIKSSVPTADAYRPIAEAVGLKESAFIIDKWGRRLENEQRRAWQ